MQKRTKRPDPKLGDRFGRLVCTGDRTHKAVNGNWRFPFQCDCGKKVSLSKYDVLLRGTKSCGCTRKNAMRKLPGQVSFTVLYVSCRQAARQRNVVFELTAKEHEDLIQNNCAYCDAAPSAYNAYVKADGSNRRTIKKTRQSTVDLSWIHANGIDRVDSNKGYVSDNCVACCANCSRAKWELSVDEFVCHIKRIADHILGNRRMT